jgi:hypothetical protein
MHTGGNKETTAHVDREANSATYAAGLTHRDSSTGSWLAGLEEDMDELQRMVNKPYTPHPPPLAAAATAAPSRSVIY